MKKIITHYLVKTIKATNAGNEIWEQMFSDFDDARSYYDEGLEDLIQATIEENGLNAEEAEKYRDNLDEDYYSDMGWLESTKDPDDEWTIGIIEYPEEVDIKTEKLYVLTQCDVEGNYTPLIFKTKEEAREAFLKKVEKYLVDVDYDEEEDGEPEQTYNGKPVIDWVNNYEIEGDKCEIVYFDGTHSVIEIFEVEVE